MVFGDTEEMYRQYKNAYRSWRKLYKTLSVDVVKFEAQDVITASGAENDVYEDEKEEVVPPGSNDDQAQA